jgi:hypothetical protein
MITIVQGFLPHLQEQTVFLFSSSSRPALVSTKPRAENVQGSFPEIKQPERKANLSHLTIAKLKTLLKLNFPSPYMPSWVEGGIFSVVLKYT